MTPTVLVAPALLLAAFHEVLKSEAAIPCASLSDRPENTFCAAWNDMLSTRGKTMLAGGPNFGTVNSFAAS
jgi:hypothetical protein